MQVIDIAHSILAFNISGGCGTVEGISPQFSAWSPTIDDRNLAFIRVVAALRDAPHLFGEWYITVMQHALMLVLYKHTRASCITISNPKQPSCKKSVWPSKNGQKR